MPRLRDNKAAANKYYAWRGYIDVVKDIRKYLKSFAKENVRIRQTLRGELTPDDLASVNRYTTWANEAITSLEQVINLNDDEKD